MIIARIRQIPYILTIYPIKDSNMIYLLLKIMNKLIELS